MGAIVLIRVLKRFAHQVPGARLALIPATVAVAVFGPADKGVSVLGDIHAGLPTLHFPQVGIGYYVRLFPGTPGLTGVTMAEGLLNARRTVEAYHAQTGQGAAGTDGTDKAGIDG